jgi:hypothetical protein
VSAARAFTYTGGDAGFQKFDITSTADSVKVAASPYSITVIDLKMDRPPAR